MKRLPALKIFVIIHYCVTKFIITRHQQRVKVIHLKNNFYFDRVFSTYDKVGEVKLVFLQIISDL